MNGDLKPGRQTTEFMALLAVYGLAIANNPLNLGFTPDDIKQLILITTVTYIGGRSVVKAIIPILTGMLPQYTANKPNPNPNRNEGG